MTNKKLNETANYLQALKAQMDVLKKEADELAETIKAELAKRNLDELDTGSVCVTFKTVKSSRLNSQALKAAHPKIYAQFMETGETKRFTIKANAAAVVQAPALQVVGAA